ncbi:MAG TPA: acyl-CoA dehydrogenase family protein [Anaerolineales bacterium]|nr:acyl-CoA dehydrogenase family protein [Anaerolineales bacterium]
MKLIAENFIENLTLAEKARVQLAEQVLPALRAHAEQSDRTGEFYAPHVETLKSAGLLGLIVPEAYGGLGGGLRDLCAVTYTLGTACPSTALAYFFHCSSASRGLLPLEALSANLFNAEEAPIVRAFAEKVLHKMGKQGYWLANFASESAKSSTAAVNISTTATPTTGGWLLNGVKSFGCATGVADEYLVTARLVDTTTADGLALFFVPRDAAGVSERSKWNSIGMRATATHGLILKDVFIADTEALTLPGAFVKMMQMSRGSFVGNQVAGIAIYLGAAQAVYDYALDFLMKYKFEDTGKPIATSPFHQELIGKMTVDLETAYLWLRRQLQLESSETPILPKPLVVRQWRMCKGEVNEACFRVAVNALKACGTGQTENSGAIARSLRDMAMGLVQAFPAERGRLEAAKMVVDGREQAQFG